MASKHISKDSDLIPIIYKVPGKTEIISGYLEKKPLPDGKKSMRFYGHYQCTNCSKKWTSGYAWQGFQLECKKCDIYEWPVKVYHLETHSDDYVMKNPHLSELCEKCQKYGVHCLATPKYGDKYSRGNKYMVHFNKQIILDSHDIIIEPSFIQNLFDCFWDTLSREDEVSLKKLWRSLQGNGRVEEEMI